MTTERTGTDDFVETVNAARLATLGMLMAGVAHELNTPLGALGSNQDSLRRALGRLQDILADEVVEPDELDEVRRIVRALDGVMRVNDMAMKRVGELVDSLRSFGRPDRAQIATVDLREGIDTAITLLQHEMRDRINVVREYEDIPLVECHPQKLNQVFMNLLLNAIHATPGRGTITVRTTPADDGVLISVRDTGTGIAKDDLARIFEAGFTTKGSRVGMGLGLKIVQQSVALHGGRIDVRSELGQGAEFRIHLPLRLPRD